MILEPDECPDVVPIWIEGLDQVMNEARTWPRWWPRWGKSVGVVFGEKVDGDRVFGAVRRRWKRLVEEDWMQRDKRKHRDNTEEAERLDTGVLSEGLKYGREAVELRKETTMLVRELVLDLRRGRGWVDEDPKAGLAETWKEEGAKVTVGFEKPKQMKDGSWVKDD
jgi:monolysocardiolipin acyltransferase